MTLQKRHNVQMPKPNRNCCKNGKQTNLLVQGTRSAVKKSQVTVDTKTLSKKQCMYHISEWHKLPLSSKVCNSQIKSSEYLSKKMFPYLAKTKKGKTRQSLMIPSLTRCNSYIIIYQFKLSKFKKGEVFSIPSLIQCNSYIIIYQFQLSKFKTGN